MKPVFYVALMILLSVSIACSAAKEDDRKEMIIMHQDEGFGLGVAIDNLDEEDQKRLGITSGAIVLDVVEDSEAERIGLKDDDVIVEFDGTKIESAEMLHDLVSEITEAKEVDLVVYRDGKNSTFQAKLEKRKPRKVSIHMDGDDFQFEDFSDLDDLTEIKIPKFHQSSSKGGFLGVSAENLSDQMLDYFEVKHGVLIEKVHEETPAEKAGLKAGDVITQIENRKITDYDDLIRTLNYYDPDETVKIEFVRKGKEKSVKVTLAKKKPWSQNFLFSGDRRPGLIHSDDHSFRWFSGDSLIDIKKSMIEVKKNLKKVKEDLKDIDIDLDFFII